jgi:flagella basal body P-ring formation protein FlgA
MMQKYLALLFCFLPPSLWADIVVPTRTLRAGDILTIDIVRLVEGENKSSFDRIEDVVGQEARTALYANRPILFDQLGPPTLIQRNQIVQVRFAGSRLMINTEGRALERGGVGDRVKVMNLSSRTTLFGYVQPDGHIAVYQ